VPRPEAQQAAHDTLLAWVSELGSGSWERFKEASGQLGLRASSALRGLSVLGHVEVSWRAPRFACAPATLTTIPGMPGRLLLCGQRPLGQADKLRSAAAEGGLDVDLNGDGAHQFGLGPATLTLEADPSDAAEFAERCGLRFAPQAAEALARVLAPLSLAGFVEPASPDQRFPHCPLDPDTLEPRWDAAGGGYEDGLWSWESFNGLRLTYLRRDGEWFLVPQREYGPYLVERPAEAPKLVRYDSANRLLYVNSRAPLPELHGRAACLCSGRLPLRQRYASDHAEDQYVNVPVAVAQAILESLDGGPA
jgi:hypothetical protein